MVLCIFFSRMSRDRDRDENGPPPKYGRSSSVPNHCPTIEELIQAQYRGKKTYMFHNLSLFMFTILCDIFLKIRGIKFRFF